jgi:hypothetical protein
MATCAPTLSARVGKQRRSVAARFHRIITAIFVAEVVFGLCLTPQPTLGLLAAASSLTPMTMAIGYCWWAGHDGLRDLMLTVSWAVLFGSFAGEVAARSVSPLIDEALGRIDCNLTARIVAWTHQYHGLSIVSAGVPAPPANLAAHRRAG